MKASLTANMASKIAVKRTIVCLSVIDYRALASSYGVVVLLSKITLAS